MNTDLALLLVSSSQVICILYKLYNKSVRYRADIQSDVKSVHEMCSMLKVCRDNSFVSGGIQNLPRVISLEHIIERVRHPSPTSPVSAADAADSEAEYCGADDIPCQLCDDGTRLPRRAVKSCLHCNASYCTTCLKVSDVNCKIYIMKFFGVKYFMKYFVKYFWNTFFIYAYCSSLSLSAGLLAWFACLSTLLLTFYPFSYWLSDCYVAKFTATK